MTPQMPEGFDLIVAPLAEPPPPRNRTALDPPEQPGSGALPATEQAPPSPMPVTPFDTFAADDGWPFRGHY